MDMSDVYFSLQLHRSSSSDPYPDPQEVTPIRGRGYDSPFIEILFSCK